MRQAPFLVLTVLLLFFPARSIAEIYQWTDSRGVVHYTDERPMGIHSAGLEAGDLPELSIVRTRSSGDFRYSVESAQTEEASGSAPGHGRTARVCAEVKAGLEQVQSQLRNGYREPRGNRLRAKRRQLRTRYFRECH
jgi:hypothetical protein